MIRFFVPGVPVPKGSAKAFVVKGRAVVTQDNGAKQKPWASAISYVAQQAKMQSGCGMFLGPVSIRLHFVMPRLSSHYGTGKNAGQVKATAPTWHTSKPDLDKLVRCSKDALTGVLWKDDSQVCMMPSVQKIYGDEPGVWIEIQSL